MKIRPKRFINEKLEEIKKEVGDRGARPSFEMLGHTGYLTFARKLVD